MAEEKKEPWLNYLALTTVILAVCATLATFRSGGYSTRAVMSQTQASDQWAYYQAKSIKGYIYEMQKEEYEIALKGLPVKGSQAVAADYRKKIAEYKKKIARYETEKAQIMKDARTLEEVRDDAKNHGQAFGIAVIFLQIAILLASIAALMKKRPLWYLSMAVGLVGILYFVNGFFLFI